MRIKNRFQAFAAHLAGSAGIALMSAVLVFLIWYPAPLAGMSGVIGIFLILLGVDVVVGPVITLIVFNLAKRELKRDLIIVLMLQIVALAYGLHTVYVARPAYLVFAVDRFDLVFANELTDEKLAAAKEERFKHVPHWGPERIAARRPEDRQRRADIMFGAIAGGDDVTKLPEFYEPLANQRAQLLKRALPLENLKPLNLQRAADVESLLRRYEANPIQAGYVPVRGKVKDAVAIVAKDSAIILEIVPLDPWP